jgi:type IV pilus assembly protein PilX
MKVRNIPRSLPNKQKGMTLLVGLILLVMLIVISTVGYRNTTLAQRMTVNATDRNVSLQAAESAGREAIELVIAAKTNAAMFDAITATNPGGKAGQFEALAKGGDASFWTQGEGATSTTCLTDTVFSWKSCAATVSSKYDKNKENAQYVIERITPSTSTVPSYRITTRSTGGSGNAEVVLQVLITP